MWGELSTALLVGLALIFYAIAGYHTILIFLGLRMTRGGPKPFDKGSLRNPVDLPVVSLVIPARDEEIVIEGALRCADRLQYPGELKEVLLVEDGSHDATPTIGQRMAAVLPNVRCLSGGPSKGKPPALNRAMAHARGDVIGVFDSDTRYEPDLLLRVAKYFHDHPDVSVVQAVPQVINRHTNAITRLTYYETRFWFQGLQAAKERFGLFMHLAGTGMFLRRSVLEALGPWDEACLTEDLEYSLRLAESGVRVGILDAHVWIQPAYRAADLVRQRERWWSGALQVFARAARGGFRVGRSRRERIDAFLYTCSPLVFLVSSLLSFGSLALFAVSGSVPAALAAWLYGFLGSQLLLTPLVLAEAALTRDRKLLWLLPGLYWYWTLQLVALLRATFAGVLARMRWPGFVRVTRPSRSRARRSLRTRLTSRSRLRARSRNEGYPRSESSLRIRSRSFVTTDAISDGSIRKRIASSGYRSACSITRSTNAKAPSIRRRISLSSGIIPPPFVVPSGSDTSSNGLASANEELPHASPDEGLEDGRN